MDALVRQGLLQFLPNFGTHRPLHLTAETALGRHDQSHHAFYLAQLPV
jgi:hypothetical protein